MCQALEELLPDAVITNTTSKGHQGDIRIKINNVETLLELKNY